MAPAFVEVIYIMHATLTTVLTGPIDTSGAAFTAVAANYPFTVAAGAPGVQQVTLSSSNTVYTAATKTLVITVNGLVHTLVFANAVGLFNITASLTCPTMAMCSGPTVTNNAANWAGLGFGDGMWPTNFYGWA
jgi:hypothetical protein